MKRRLITMALMVMTMLVVTVSAGAVEDITVSTAQELYNALKGSEQVANYITLDSDIVLDATMIGDDDTIVEYFPGILDGDSHKLTLINTSEKSYTLIKFPYGAAQVKNLNVEFQGVTITPIATQITDWSNGDKDGTSVVFDNINILDNEDAVWDISSNTSPFLFHITGDFQMKNCNNYEQFNGTGYQAIFVGGMAVCKGNVSFENCNNYGDLKGEAVGLLVGNPYINYNKVNYTPNMTVTNCHNYGTITGTTSANVFCTNVGSGNYNTMNATYPIADINATTEIDGVTYTGTIAKVDPAYVITGAVAEDGSVSIADTSDPIEAAQYGVKIWGYAYCAENSSTWGNGIFVKADTLAAFNEMGVRYGTLIDRLTFDEIYPSVETYKPLWDTEGSEALNGMTYEVAVIDNVIYYILDIVSANGVYKMNLTTPNIQVVAVNDEKTQIASVNASKAGSITVPDIAATVGNVGYFSFTDAMAAAEDGDTVTILEDTSAATLSTDKNITLTSANDATLTATSIEATGDAKVTLSKLTIAGSELTLTGDITERRCDLSAQTTITATDADLSYNYFGDDGITGVTAATLYPYYSDAEMTILVNEDTTEVDQASKAEDILKDDTTSAGDKLGEVGLLDKNEIAKDENLMNDIYDVEDQHIADVNNDDTTGTLETGATVTAISESAVSGANEVESVEPEDLVIDTTVANKTEIKGITGAIMGNTVPAKDTTVTLGVNIAQKDAEVAENEAGEVEASVTYDVKPYKQVNNGAKTIVDNKDIHGTITFKMFLPDLFTRTNRAEVQHESDAAVQETVYQEDGHAYIWVTATEFSEFTVKYLSYVSTSSGVSSFGVSVSEPTGCDISVSSSKVAMGKTVTITADLADGYTLVVYKHGDKELALTDLGGGKYSFVMPGTSVVVTAIAAEKEEEPEAAHPFVDVDENAYYYDAMLWAVENGITAGTTDTTFAPSAPCTRGQIVTFLYRAAGSPAVTGDTDFVDVDENAYYHDAMVWAVQNGITAGTTATTFDPSAPCTRGQIVTFLWRAAGTPDVSGSALDVNADSYCYDAVIWAVDEGITTGYTDGTFGAPDACNRGQIVTFLYRYMGE